MIRKIIEANAVCPAPAGMSPSRPPVAWLTLRLPRTRGDEPGYRMMRA